MGGKNIKYLIALIVALTIYSCHGSYGHIYECYAKNITTLYKNSVPIDTFIFCDTQERDFPNEYISVKNGHLTKGPLSFSKDSVLKFFHTEKEYDNRKNFYEKYGHLDVRKNCGLIVIPNSHLSAPTLFITLDGYKQLELCDYDSITIIFTFDSYMYTSKEMEIDYLIDMGYEFN